MYLILLIITIVICGLLVLMVMIQNPKGGGLSSNFSSSSQLMGVQKTGDFLEKGTWALAIGLMVLSLIINIAVKGGTQTTEDRYKAQREKASKPIAPVNAPINLPATPQPTAPPKK